MEESVLPPSHPARHRERDSHTLCTMNGLARTTGMAIRATASTSRAVLQHATARSHAGLATVTRRTISATALRRSGPGSGPGSGDDGDDPGFVRPGPPPLPPSEQREFERLVREKASEYDDRQTEVGWEMRGGSRC